MVSAEIHSYLDELAKGNVYGKVTLTFDKGVVISSREELTWKAAEIKTAYPVRKILKVKEVVKNEV